MQLDHVKNAKKKEDFWSIVSLKNEAEAEIGKIYKNVDENNKTRFQLYDEVDEWIYDVTCETETQCFSIDAKKTMYSLKSENELWDNFLTREAVGGLKFSEPRGEMKI